MTARQKWGGRVTITLWLCWGGAGGRGKEGEGRREEGGGVEVREKVTSPGPQSGFPPKRREDLPKFNLQGKQSKAAPVRTRSSSADVGNRESIRLSWDKKIIWEPKSLEGF